jgi:hypothetical protein
MSLELAINENTATLRLLITLLQSGAALPASLTVPETAAAAPAPATERKPRTRAAGSPELNDGKKVSVKLVEGDPEGTRYFHIPKHSTVCVVKPGEVVPSIEGTVEIGGEGYLKLKEEYAAKKPETTGSTSTDSSAKQDDAAAPGVVWDDLLKQIVVLSKDERATCGRAGVKTILDKYKVAKVPELQALDKNADILADVTALLNPAAAEDDLF